MKKNPVNEQERRLQIMDAFIVHVVEKGFHKASMADVAKTAELSVGQIYRYFAHKEDIIRAVVERKTEEYLQMMEQFLDKKDWLTRIFEPENESEFRTQRILNMEIKAEANRSPILAKIQLEADQRLTEHAIHLVRRKYDLDNEEDIKARIQFLVALTDGLLHRRDFFAAPYNASSHRVFNHMLNELFPD
ncbi:TetR/AcrR family transcriptional regulator [Marinomonas ostreistagni]|uniref:TetR/AcrR family transcriptional regulator n=1 Tax=Marinomonas ostreistagni TaxID=359209 RepID=A0ABS0Z7X8_9GAMM|nr:TetR/AcrR family transcriptional regulator [Marinomonas ostreistagni]MBJ7549755.1 TetR/AcrR family transcriptional regulator [Marinomonas ostreistagni]